MIIILTSVEISALALFLLARPAGFDIRIHAIKYGTTLRLSYELTKLSSNV